uniref:DnaA ATPase domain-containing protein n=1 Tax=Mycobacteroides abscessus TaxID=36809 RepID=UPI000C25D616|nr:DnaA/Hda family protein [Mycobacteroides abscessus]
MLRSNRQVVMAADRSPDEIGDVANLLRNYEWSLIADVSAPDIEMLAHIRPPSRG